MKTKNLLLAGILGILTATTAGAQTVIYISGAPAARKPFSTAIYNVLLASVSGSSGLITYAYSGNASTTLTNANALTFYGGQVTVSGSHVPVTVQVSYVGSSAGIQAVAAQKAVQFLPAGDTPGGSPYPEPNGNANAAQYQLAVPQFTASDEFQGSTPWQGINSLTGTSVNYQTLHSDVVGILPYRWVTNVDAPSSITNITPNQARGLFETGYLYLSQFTGQNADEGGIVYAIGRDIGSGLRTVLLSETGIGVQTQITQYAPVVTSTTGSYISGLYTTGSGAVLLGTYTYITSQSLYPNETVNGVPLLNGDGGYGSFTGLQADLGAYTNSNHGSLVNPSLSGTAGWYVTALADSDAQTALHAGSHEVAWNGVYLGALPAGGGASSQLSEGYYTFWSYLQLQYLASQFSLTANAAASALEGLLVTDLKNTDATVLLKNVNIGRFTDGGNIVPYNPYP